MKITFSISSPVKGAISKLMAEVSSCKCRIHVDLRNRRVEASEVDSVGFQAVIDVIENCFEITGVDIDTTDAFCETQGTAIEEKAEIEHEAAEVESEDEKPIARANSADDLIVNKIEFQNSDVEMHMNKLNKICHWMVYRENASAEDIVKHLISTQAEIAMRFNPKDYVSVKVGDIVDCNYGTHIESEISGGHVFSLVCNIVNDLVFVIPITKQVIEGQFYLPLRAGKNVVYAEPDRYKEGTLLLSRGSYISIERVQKVVGNAFPEFFEEVIEVLPEVYCFEGMPSTNKPYETESVNDFEPSDNNTREDVQSAACEVEDNAAEADSITENAETVRVSTDTDFSRFDNFEEVLAELIGEKVKSLNKDSDLEPQLDDFLASIGMPNDTLIKQALVAACEVKKVKYDSIIFYLEDQNSRLEYDEIKQVLKDTFKAWINTNYPTITERFPKFSIISLLKFFAKNFSNS